MISRKLKVRGVNYATNERELLAIFWALGKLRHYLYAVKVIKDIKVPPAVNVFGIGIKSQFQNQKVEGGHRRSRCKSFLQTRQREFNC